MNGKIRNSAILAILAILAIAIIGQPAHAQNVTIGGQYDQASYVPGQSGTLTVSIVNDGGNPIELRNITIYFPWAQLINGKWPTSPAANVSDNISPFVEIGSQSSGSNIYTWSTSFTVPSWYAGSIFGSGSNCPGYTDPRYDTSYHGCIIVGISGNPPGYETQHFSIAMALPTYTPTSLQTEWFSIATIAILGVLAILMAMVWNSTRRLSKK
jgi:hypothetical protein